MAGNVEVTEKGGVRLQPKNHKWYRVISLVQMAVFAAMHLVLGLYFAFISSEYVNHPGFTTRIEAHRNLDQICAIVCFALFVIGLRLFYGLLKQKKISALYYVYMAVSALLPIAYLLISSVCVTNAMAEVLNEVVAIDGQADTNELVFWGGIEFGAWANGGEYTVEHDKIFDYLARIGEEAYAWVDLSDFNMSGLVRELRNEMYNWYKFELYAIVNAVLSVAFVVCGAIFLPKKKSKLIQK